MKNQAVVREVAKILRSRVIKLIVRYGAERGYDIDILAVTGNGKPAFRGHQYLDIRELSLEDFKYRIKHFDPIVTEPILTGQMITGDKKLFDWARFMLKTRKLNKRIIESIRSKAALEYFSTKGCLERAIHRRGKERCRYLLKAMRHFSTMASYLWFADYYGSAKKPRVITFNELRKKDNERKVSRWIQQAEAVAKRLRNGEKVSLGEFHKFLLVDG